MFSFLRNEEEKKMKRVSTEKMAEIIERHGQWVRGADLSEADMTGTDLRWANR